MQDMKMTDQFAGHENAKHKIAGHIKKLDYMLDAKFVQLIVDPERNGRRSTSEDL